MMKWSEFRPRIRALEPYVGRFDAFRLTAQGCDALFGTYSGGTRTERHIHPNDNWGVITKGEMVIAMNGADTRYAPGDWYHVPAEVERSAYCGDVGTEEGGSRIWFRVSDRE